MFSWAGPALDRALTPQALPLGLGPGEPVWLCSASLTALGPDALIPGLPSGGTEGWSRPAESVCVPSLLHQQDWLPT